MTALDFWLRIALVCLGMLAVLKLGSEYYRLVFGEGHNAAIDLALRHSEIQYWFSGESVYGSFRTATYPPASFLIQWPIAGWISLQATRWMWAALYTISLAWMVLLLIRESGATSLTGRWFIALVALSMNATGIAVGNGQLAVLILPLLILILVLMKTGKPGWRTDLAIALLFLLTLVKPTFSAPFFLVLLIVLPGYRAVIACAAGYLLLTFLATLFQPQGFTTLILDWLAVALASNTAAAVNLDYGSVHTWLTWCGLARLNSVASFSLLFLLGAWIYQVRKIDTWLIYGVTALVARIWTYHGLYDDMLIIIPIIAVYRHARQISGGSPIKASTSWLLTGAVFAMLLPARLFNAWAAPWPFLYASCHIFMWAWLLVYLLKAAATQRQGLYLQNA